MGKETAEQKLLKLIENTEAQESAQVQTEQAPVSNEAMKVLDSVKGVGTASMVLPQFMEKVISVAKNPALLLKMIASCGVKELNMFLMVGIGIVSIFFIVNFSKGMSLSGQDVHFAIPENVKNVSENIFPTFKELSEYIEVVSRRNIFNPFERKVVEVEPEIPEEVRAVQLVTEKTKDFKLVGISWLDTPESAEAMLEDKVSGVTHFLRKGDSLQGVKVKNIYTDGITIVFDSQEMEMRL